jgi:DNA mismatch repair protein MutL
MGRIELLPDHVASQVAAGEVVERPASVVKELAENSLDAAARRITIEFAGGGIRALSVCDDGCGMDRDDALLCLERHATSKIRTAADLAVVQTMGFRGEALPSIASVSRFRILTRPPDAGVGTEVRVLGGRLDAVEEAGCAPGTLIEVKDLFFNIPARRKFVRGEETESAHIVQTVQAFAIAASEVGIELRREGRCVFQLPPAKKLEDRLRDLFGSAFLERMVALGPVEDAGVVIEGFAGRPGEGRRDRHQQIVILNGRPVASPEVSGALREAYAGLLTAGLQPLAVLRISLDPALADCNAHPAKRVVRFARPDVIRRVVFDAVRSALVSPSPPPSQKIPEPAPLRVPEPGLLRPRVLGGATVLPPQLHPGPPFDPPVDPAPAPSPYRLLGRLGREFAVFEGLEGLVLLDLRAARERIAFERLLRQMEAGEAPSQRLLLPVIVELPAREHAWIVENMEALGSAGFRLESFGGVSMKIEAVPAAVGDVEPGKVLHDVASSLRAAGRMPRGHGLREIVARSVCRAAAEPDNTTDPTLLLEQLLLCELPYAAASGRPTMIQISFAELDRKFGRGST